MRSRLNRCPSCPASVPHAHAGLRLEALPQPPDLRHPPPRGAWASGLDPVAPTAPGRAAEAGLGRHVLGRADDAELLGERASHPDANGRRVALAVSESALSEGTPPVWPWTGARCLVSVVPGASERLAPGLLCRRSVGRS
eukprot:scaffold6611_cov112-Isochrysis_galbana.AAC.1